MTHEMAHSNEHEKDTTWHATRDHLNRIKEDGGFQNAITHEPAAFPEKVTCVCCMDERVVNEKSDAVYSAGSGILIKDDPKKWKAFVKELKAAGVTNACTHEGCGAVGLYAKQKNISLEQAIEESRESAKKLAAELGGEYEGELTVSPEDYHVAQTAYYDLTGRFNPGMAVAFPPGFVISRKYMPAEDALAQTKVGVGIAQGEHGYGKRFDKKNPFVIVVVADTAADLAKGKKEVKGLAGPSVIIDGFVRETAV